MPGFDGGLHENWARRKETTVSSPHLMEKISQRPVPRPRMDRLWFAEGTGRLLHRKIVLRGLQFLFHWFCLLGLSVGFGLLLTLIAVNILSPGYSAS
jgi:hypothetical protein